MFLNSVLKGEHMNKFTKSLLISTALIGSLFSVGKDDILLENPNKSKCIYGQLWGQLGNQLFIIAAALSAGLDYDANVSFPCLDTVTYNGIPLNRELFYPFLSSKVYNKKPILFKENEDYLYRPIPDKKATILDGYFQSEKYFKNHKDFIINLFKAPKEVKEELHKRFPEVVEHKCSVGIHVRAYMIEHPNHDKVYPILTRNYYEEVAKSFPHDALFVIFSDKIDYAKKVLKGFSRPHIFVEGNDYYYDFYLLSMCKHQILYSSSFGWWAAYLNENLDKRVIVPYPWFKDPTKKSRDIVPDEWEKFNWKKTI